MFQVSQHLQLLRPSYSSGHHSCVEQHSSVEHLIEEQHYCSTVAVLELIHIQEVPVDVVVVVVVVVDW